jgi:hypothetical protein
MPSPSLQSDFPIRTVQASRVGGIAEDRRSQSAMFAEGQAGAGSSKAD